MRCLPEKIYELPSVAIQKLKKYTYFEDLLRQIFYDFYVGRFVYIIVIIISVGMIKVKIIFNSMKILILVVSFSITYAMIWNNARIVYIFYVTTMPCGIGIYLKI